MRTLQFRFKCITYSKLLFQENIDEIPLFTSGDSDQIRVKLVEVYFILNIYYFRNLFSANFIRDVNPHAPAMRFFSKELIYYAVMASLNSLNSIYFAAVK